MKQINFNNHRKNLTENDIDQIVKLVTSYCRVNIIQKIRANLTYFKGSIPYYEILERVIKENDLWLYCAGQDYREEIKTVRKIFLELK